MKGRRFYTALAVCGLVIFGLIVFVDDPRMATPHEAGPDCQVVVATHVDFDTSAELPSECGHVTVETRAESPIVGDPENTEDCFMPIPRFPQIHGSSVELPLESGCGHMKWYVFGVKVPENGGLDLLPRADSRPHQFHGGGGFNPNFNP